MDSTPRRKRDSTRTGTEEEGPVSTRKARSLPVVSEEPRSDVVAETGKSQRLTDHEKGAFPALEYLMNGSARRRQAVHGEGSLLPCPPHVFPAGRYFHYTGIRRDSLRSPKRSSFHDFTPQDPELSFQEPCTEDSTAQV